VGTIATSGETLTDSAGTTAATFCFSPVRSLPYRQTAGWSSVAEMPFTE
jgi:hypothetical protein